MRDLARVIAVLFSLGVAAGRCAEAAVSRQQLDDVFVKDIQPLLQAHCIRCHGADGKAEADLNLQSLSSTAKVLEQPQFLAKLAEVLDKRLMPPETEKNRPAPEQSQSAARWFKDARRYEIERNAGDPGIVLARRLSHAEYNNSIRDLTGVDMQLTKQFPVDSTNSAGFDNTGETLVMSSTLLKKYLEAARTVADSMYLKESGLAFAPHAMLVETDRDKFCVHQIINFYHQFNIDYSDYFLAAWKHKRQAPGAQTLEEAAKSDGLSVVYLRTVWNALEGNREEVGPLAQLQKRWQALPASDDAAAARSGCDEMKEFVTTLRAKVELRFFNLSVGGRGGGGSQFMLWRNEQYARHRRQFDPRQLQIDGKKTPYQKPNENGGGEFGPGTTPVVENEEGDPDLFVPAGELERYKDAFARFASIFPDMFYKEERGRSYFDTKRDRGRYLSAGFHSIMGYFRDDYAFYELILNPDEQRQLDQMWFELDLVASANTRMHEQFGGRRGRGGEAAPSPKVKVTDESEINKQRASLVASAQGNAEGVQAANWYYDMINASIRRVERVREESQPSHLAALEELAQKAFRRPLRQQDRDDLQSFYRQSREERDLDHEAAVRETLVMLLMSPDFLYRFEATGLTDKVEPLSDRDLASRLSFFLWSTLPDAHLLAAADAGELHKPDVLRKQVKRMLQDPRAKALALEFGGNWLDFRHFKDSLTVDTQRFPTFTPELQAAMFEEPVRVLQDIIQNNRNVLDLLNSDQTFVNGVLAEHYGIEFPGKQPTDWVRVDHLQDIGRGGILGMAVFLTKNSPGLRTSPVKRGNWVVKTVLGEQIPAPPAIVPDLPQDEAKADLPLRQLLERHRADANCAACHARFDSYGLVFEGFGPIGERRTMDLASRPVDDRASFPGNVETAGLAGVRDYIRQHRQQDFVNGLCEKMTAYALGRSLILADQLLIEHLQQSLAADGYRFENLVSEIVASPQFLNKRGENPATAER